MRNKFSLRSRVLLSLAAACSSALLVSVSTAGALRNVQSILPNGWIVGSPPGASVETGTMPQGAAASPDGKVLAVVESGYNPATLRLYETTTLHEIRKISLPGAFGRPRWNGAHVLVAGANADAVFDVDTNSGTTRKIPFPAKSYPIALAISGDRIAVATDGDGSVRVGTLDEVASARAIRVGEHPANVTFSSDGNRLFVAVRSASYVDAIDLTTNGERRVPTGLHPSDVLANSNELYVAESDDDSVGIYDAGSGAHIATIFVGNGQRDNIIGASPNALASFGNDIFVSLGAANEIAVLRNHQIVAHVPAGWYPTDMVPEQNQLFIVNGKGEGTRPNPDFNPKGKSDRGYVAAIQFGSIRAVPFNGTFTAAQNPQGSAGWDDPSPGTVVRANGPIKHVFFILKENRSYDQVLGDMPQGNGDRSLVWFGKQVTPNQHALAARFGLFDNAYASGEVSASGHNWADAAFANDYVERYWPSIYGNRNNAGDLNSGVGAAVPHSGYLWDSARRAGVSFRDYGELTSSPSGVPTGPITKLSLANRFDPNYISWNLDYSDLDRVKEWRREFESFIRNGSLPQFEFIWLPNDHTYGSAPGKLTPVALVAQNDYAVGEVIQTISHSPVWRSSAIFITEDDAQDGPDHVSAQRTTLYVVSPYASGGVHHGHYSTLSVVRTIELLLGMKPLSTYDAKAVPLYAAFSANASQKPFDAIAPMVDIHTRNSKVAYDARLSAQVDFSRPDAAPAGALLDILAHNHQIANKR